MIRKLGALMLLVSVAACAGMPSASNDNGRNGGNGLVANANGSVKAASILQAAEATRDEGRFAEAMQIYQEVLVADPTSIAAQYGVAECLLGLGKPSEARAMFEALGKHGDYKGVAMQGRGLAFLAANQREPAAKALRAATEIDPKLWRAWNGLGLLADLKRAPHEAEAAYAHALAVNPNSAALYNNLGYSRLLAGKPDDAIAEFRKALALDPQSETVRNNYRLAIAAKGNYNEALRGVPREQLATVLNNVGYVAMRRGDVQVAEGYFARAMETSSSFNAVASKNLEQLKGQEAKP